jgi:hypothetical protein
MRYKLGETRTIQQSEEVHDCYQSFSILNSPPRLSRKRKSHHNDCLVIPTKLLELRPDFLIPTLNETDSKYDERKVQSTKFKLFPRQRTTQSPPRLCKKEKSSHDDCLVVPAKVQTLQPTCSVPDLCEITSTKEERKTQSTEFKLYTRQRTAQYRLKALMGDINHCIL